MSKDKDALFELHSKVTEHLIDELDSEKVPPATVANAIKWLNMNNITIDSKSPKDAAANKIRSIPRVSPDALRLA